MKFEELEVGKTYKVKMYDCCVRGHFEAKVERLKIFGNDVEGVWFDNGVYLDYCLQCDFEEIRNGS